MKLSNLLSALRSVDGASDARFASLDLAGISADSRRVRPGELFVAVTGTRNDGLRFVDQALASGAAAVMAEGAPERPLPQKIALINVNNVRRALALAAAQFFPRVPGVIAAVTGTSGKTSVAAFTRQIWSQLGLAAASIGTVGLVSPKRETYGALTTPDPIALHRSVGGLAGGDNFLLGVGLDLGDIGGGLPGEPLRFGLGFLLRFGAQGSDLGFQVG